ncbi:MAG: hypothetical protein JXQ83_02040 [Candidatus Glassbacteria bacterium]|nr:hypothetical protein [Candidatus Glassbacteria bacterium]
MAGKLKNRLLQDPLELQELISRNKKELEEARAELQRLGNELKSEHVRLMLHPEEIKLSGKQEDPSLNPMCRKCLNSCKQSDSVRIISCSKYEPVD